MQFHAIHDSPFVFPATPAEVEALDRAAAKVPKQLIQNSFQTS